MTFMEKLDAAWKKSGSLVCVGLDPDLAKMPDCVKGAKYPIFEFNKAIIDATADAVCCYKPQAAYYAGQERKTEIEFDCWMVGWMDDSNWKWNDLCV